MSRIPLFAILFLFTTSMSAAKGLPEPTAKKLPIWRGFNLLEKFYKGPNTGPFKEEDFQLISKWGFNFVRLPMDYRTWIKDGDWRKFDEAALKDIDQALDWGRKYGIHVCVNFHRGPGYTVASPKEEKNLWTDAEAQEVFCLHWATFAKRYKGRPNSEVSFDLINEPADVSNEAYANVVKLAVAAIHKEDPKRLVIADSNNYGNKPVPELVPFGVAQMTRGYGPFQLTHYGASWVGDNKNWPVPTFSPEEKDKLWNDAILPFKDLESKGVGIHVGEWGAYNQTPHDVVLAWMEACLQNWKNAGWGWALWNFRGSFGVMDSGRKDVAYEDFQGHKLDREMLELLRRY